MAERTIAVADLLMQRLPKSAACFMPIPDYRWARYAWRSRTKRRSELKAA
ncbi:MAG: hypothetical protein P8Z80_17985 [Pseudolabrys sp.]